ncbi:hypothetical protein CHUAL_000577 [Chamberlinius hualienensis]
MHNEPSTPSTTAFHSSNETSESTEIIRNIADLPEVDNATPSAVLHYCKRKVLVPYQRFLSMLGWRPIVVLQDEGIFTKLGITLYTVVVILFTILGYILQYAACFRKDAIPGYKLVNLASANGTKTSIVCIGTPVNTYFIPDILHLSAYAYMYYLTRIRENEHLQVLMERVFLQAFYSRSSYSTQSKIVRILRIFLLLAVSWITISMVTQFIHINTEYPSFTWMNTNNQTIRITLTVLLLLTTIWTDLIHVTIIVSYSIQCELLNFFIRGLCERVREKSITLEETIREIGESTKILKYLNEDFAISVALIMLHSGIMILSGVVWAGSLLGNIGKVTAKDALVIVVNCLCIIMWTSSFIFPLIQAARLTAACQCFKKLGLYLMSRPFGYQDESLSNLQPFLSYTTSLNLQAKLFRIPVKPWALFAILTLICFILIILSRCGVINLGI